MQDSETKGEITVVTENRKRDLIKNIEKLEAYQEIQNEMGRTVAALISGRPIGCCHISR